MLKIRRHFAPVCCNRRCGGGGRRSWRDEWSSSSVAEQALLCDFACVRKSWEKFSTSISDKKPPKYVGRLRKRKIAAACAPGRDPSLRRLKEWKLGYGGRLVKRVFLYSLTDRLRVMSEDNFQDFGEDLCTLINRMFFFYEFYWDVDQNDFY